MSGGQKMDAFKTRSWTRNGRKGKNVVDAPTIRPCRNQTRREEPFDFGCEKQPIVLSGPKEWRDTETITSELELSPLFIPKRDGELTTQSFPHLLPMIF